MARVTHRLTAIKVASLKTPGLHPDGHGLYLRITDTGTKGWIWRYYVDGKSRDMGLGPVSTVSLAQARQLASEYRLKRREGLDPIQHREHVRRQVQIADARGMSFKECALAQLADSAGVTIRTVHRLEAAGVISVAPARRHGHVSQDVWKRIVKALQTRGVELISETDQHGSGARWTKPRSSREFG